MSTLTIQISDPLRRGIEHLAASAGISVDEFFSAIAAEKLAALEASDYLARRAARGNREAFLAVLANVPDVPPTEEWDQLPPGWPPQGWNEKVSKASS